MSSDHYMTCGCRMHWGWPCHWGGRAIS